MDWITTLTEIDAFLSDDKIRADVIGFLAAVGYKLEADGQTVLFPKDTHSLIEERTLIRNSSVKGGGYFLVKCDLISTSLAGDRSHALGKIKIMYDLNGVYLDEFYSAG